MNFFSNLQVANLCFHLYQKQLSKPHFELATLDKQTQTTKQTRETGISTDLYKLALKRIHT